MFALENNIKQVITLDCDGQHDPGYIPEFLKCDKSIDIAVGKRDFTKNMPIHRRFSNNVTSMIISLMCRKRIKDSQSGYRRYNLNIFKELDFKEFGFQFESEAIIKYARNQAKFNYIDISTIYNNESSSQRIIIDTLKFIRMIVKNFR